MFLHLLFFSTLSQALYCTFIVAFLSVFENVYAVLQLLDLAAAPFPPHVPPCLSSCSQPEAA